jgi:hypothetical protein
VKLIDTGKPSLEREAEAERQAFNIDAYSKRIQNGPCFICEMMAGNLDGKHVIYQNNVFTAFLNKYPVLEGYTLVAPIHHQEHVTGDFTLDEYLELQRSIYQIAEAVRQGVETERVYILSLGSKVIVTFTGILHRCLLVYPPKNSNSRH